MKDGKIESKFKNDVKTLENFHIKFRDSLILPPLSYCSENQYSYVEDVIKDKRVTQKMIILIFSIISGG